MDRKYFDVAINSLLAVSAAAGAALAALHQERLARLRVQVPFSHLARRRVYGVLSGVRNLVVVLIFTTRTSRSVRRSPCSTSDPARSRRSRRRLHCKFDTGRRNFCREETRPCRKSKNDLGSRRGSRPWFCKFNTHSTPCGSFSRHRCTRRPSS